MTKLRLRAVTDAEDVPIGDAVRRGAVSAATLRALIAALSVALLFLGVLAGA